MSKRFNRRDFLLGGAGAGLAAAAAPGTLFGEVSGGFGAPSAARGQCLERGSEVFPKRGCRVTIPLVDFAKS